MHRSKKLVVLLAGAGLLIALWAVRRGRNPDPSPAVRPIPAELKSRPAPPRTARPTRTYTAPAPRPVSPVVPQRTIVAAMDETRVRTTYENFRRALASGNSLIEKRLRPVLLRNRKTAIRFAEEDLARSSDPAERRILKKMLQVLGRVS